MNACLYIVFFFLISQEQMRQFKKHFLILFCPAETRNLHSLNLHAPSTCSFHFSKSYLVPKRHQSFCYFSKWQLSASIEIFRNWEISVAFCKKGLSPEIENELNLWFERTRRALLIGLFQIGLSLVLTELRIVPKGPKPLIFYLKNNPEIWTFPAKYRSKI